MVNMLDLHQIALILHLFVVLKKNRFHSLLLFDRHCVEGL